MELAGEFFAVSAAIAELGEADFGVDDAFAEEVEEVRDEGHVFPITNFLADVAVFEFVLNEAGVKRVRVTGGGFEQGGFEGQDGFAVGAGAFRK